MESRERRASSGEVLPVSHAVINKLGGRRERRRRKELKSFTIRHFHSGNKQESVGSTQREARKEGFSTIRSPTLAGSKRRIERGGLSFFSLCGRRWPTSNLRLPKTLASSGGRGGDGSPTFSKVEACLPERASPRSRSRARCQNLILGLRHELSEKKRGEERGVRRRRSDWRTDKLTSADKMCRTLWACALLLLWTAARCDAGAYSVDDAGKRERGDFSPIECLGNRPRSSLE